MRRPSLLKLQPERPTIKAHDEEKAQAEAIFASIGDGAIATNELGEINRVNHAALSLLGYTAEELLGKWYPGIITAEAEDGARIDTLERPIMKAVFTGRAISERLYYRRKDGSRLPVTLTVAPIILDGRPLGTVELFRDITHELEMESVKDEFISLASHQLRTPATGVKQYVGMVLEGYAGELTPKQRALLEKAYESNERQLNIVNDLLKVAHIDAGKITLKKERVDIVRLTRDVLHEQLEKFDSRDQKLHFNYPQRELVVIIDIDRMRMVLENLIDNASKYTPEDKQIRVEIVARPKEVCVAVKDEGVGIAKKDLSKLFQKFSRVDNPLSGSVGGTGLGLYWAKKIIDLHGGSIKVTSHLNKGTKFAITLPRR